MLSRRSPSAPQTGQQTKWRRVCAGAGGELLEAAAGDGAAGAWEVSVVMALLSHRQNGRPPRCCEAAAIV